jgi:hypothetical protein
MTLMLSGSVVIGTKTLPGSVRVGSVPAEEKRDADGVESLRLTNTPRRILPKPAIKRTMPARFMAVADGIGYRE